MDAAFVYIMSNKSRTLYTGSTTDLLVRVRQHKTQQGRNAFTGRYRFTRLVYFETFATREAAFDREMEIKGWRRARKIALIQTINPNWVDLTPRIEELLCLR